MLPMLATAPPTRAGLLFHVIPVSAHRALGSERYRAGPLPVGSVAYRRRRARVTGAEMPATLNRRKLCTTGELSASRSDWFPKFAVGLPSTTLASASGSTVIGSGGGGGGGGGGGVVEVWHPVEPESTTVAPFARMNCQS